MTEKIYYKFIQFALGTYEGKEFLDGSALNGFDWQRFYDFAKKQTLVGIIMEGISRLPKAVAPKQGLLMNWFMMSQNISRMNFMLNEATVGVYNRVKAAGYDCCILKGQANAAMYANPAARTPGDVDMWVDASREEIRKLAQTLAKENGRIDEESYNHIALTTNDISVELHYTPGFMANFTYNRRLQQWFRESIDAQCRNMIALPDEAGEVAAPTADFNAVYQLYHLYHHYFYEGVGLRQVVDYYYVILNFELGVLNCRLRDEELKNCELESQNSKLNNSKSAKPTIQNSKLKTQNSLTRLGLWHFAGAYSTLCANFSCNKFKNSFCVVVKSTNNFRINLVFYTKLCEIGFKAFKVISAILAKIVKNKGRILGNILTNRTLTVKKSHRIFYKSVLAGIAKFILTCFEICL